MSIVRYPGGMKILAISNQGRSAEEHALDELRLDVWATEHGHELVRLTSVLPAPEDWGGWDGVVVLDDKHLLPVHRRDAFFEMCAKYDRPMFLLRENVRL